MAGQTSSLDESGKRLIGLGSLLSLSGSDASPLPCRARRQRVAGETARGLLLAQYKNACEELHPPAFPSFQTRATCFHLTRRRFNVAGRDCVGTASAFPFRKRGDWLRGGRLRRKSAFGQAQEGWAAGCPIVLTRTSAYQSS